MSSEDERQDSEASSSRSQPLRQRTKAYALQIIRLYSTLPRTPEAQILGKQLLRSGTSVGANYREGNRARSTAEMIAKFGICIQEFEESAYWMELPIESGMIAENAMTSILDETYQLIAIFTSSVKRLLMRKGER